MSTPDSQLVAGASAARDDLGPNAQLLITHLLTNYHTILPRNPRLIIRVATAWAMLRAVARSLGLEVDQEPANQLLVRAAVIWVRFPILVDTLLNAAQPPIIDPTDTGCDPKWRRRDVQQVLHLDNGELLDIEALALYYGTFFDKPVPTPHMQQSSLLVKPIEKNRDRKNTKTPTAGLTFHRLSTLRRTQLAKWRSGRRSGSADAAKRSKIWRP
jgi:hypothetical protein